MNETAIAWLVASAVFCALMGATAVRWQLLQVEKWETVNKPPKIPPWGLITIGAILGPVLFPPLFVAFIIVKALEWLMVLANYLRIER